MLGEDDLVFGIVCCFRWGKFLEMILCSVIWAVGDVCRSAWLCRFFRCCRFFVRFVTLALLRFLLLVSGVSASVFLLVSVALPFLVPWQSVVFQFFGMLDYERVAFVVFSHVVFVLSGT